MRDNMKETNIRSNEALINAINNMMYEPEYVFFWGGGKPRSGVSETCFSQWYPSIFNVSHLTFPTAEHYMMATKAALHNDEESINKILKAKHPSDAKRLGRRVKNFNDKLWNSRRMDVVVTGTYEKFKQNLELREYLLSTGDKVLVEASPVDNIWGIGMAAGAPGIDDPANWKGLNLLGYALMEARKRLRQDSSLDAPPVEVNVESHEPQTKTSPTKDYPYSPYRSMFA